MENQMTNTDLEIIKRLKELEELKTDLPSLIIDLYWEYDRMSSDGQRTLDQLARINNIPTEQDMQKKLKQYHKNTA